MNEWKEVEPDAPEIHRFEDAAELVGYYVGRSKSSGSEFGTDVHVFELENGQRVGVWDSYALADKLVKIAPGELTRITFEGYRKFEDKATGQERSVKVFKVYAGGRTRDMGEPATPLEESSETPTPTDDDIPF